MHIIITTDNKAKVEAVKQIFEKVWTDIYWTQKKFPSDISEQPISEKEGITGALNRTQNAQKELPNADFYVGMEGFVDENEFGMFLGGAVVILKNNGEIGIGISGKMQIPSSITLKINQGEELGPLVRELINDHQDLLRQYDGTNGLLSKGLYNRVDEFKDATKCALARFQSPEYYE